MRKANPRLDSRLCILPSDNDPFSAMHRLGVPLKKWFILLDDMMLLLMKSHVPIESHYMEDVFFLGLLPPEKVVLLGFWR